MASWSCPTARSTSSSRGLVLARLLPAKLGTAGRLSCRTASFRAFRGAARTRARQRRVDDGCPAARRKDHPLLALRKDDPPSRYETYPTSRGTARPRRDGATESSHRGGPMPGSPHLPLLRPPASTARGDRRTPRLPCAYTHYPLTDSQLHH